MTRAEAIAYLERDGGAVPCSRYGRDGGECAPVAAVLAEIIGDAGAENVTADSLEHAMGLVVNDHDDVETLIRSYGDAEQIATLEEALR